MELKLKNIGMINEANVKIDGLSVIAGENDTGKSTVGKALFMLLYHINHTLHIMQIKKEKGSISLPVLHKTNLLEQSIDAIRLPKLIFDNEITNSNIKIDYINAHGTSTPANDKNETLAIKQLFGDEVPPVSSTKGQTGHCLGAAGGIEAVICLMAMEEGVIPPTINYQTPDEYCDLDYVPNQARQADLNIVMSNSFGFGGTNGVVIFKKV